MGVNVFMAEWVHLFCWFKWIWD